MTIKREIEKLFKNHKYDFNYFNRVYKNYLSTKRTFKDKTFDKELARLIYKTISWQEFERNEFNPNIY
jgi:hypothetical protein